jgi:hypothetical protein
MARWRTIATLLLVWLAGGLSPGVADGAGALSVAL